MFKQWLSKWRNGKERDLFSHPLELGKNIIAKLGGYTPSEIEVEVVENGEPKYYKSVKTGLIDEVHLSERTINGRWDVTIDIFGHFSLKNGVDKGKIIVDQLRHYDPLVQISCLSLCERPRIPATDRLNDKFDMSILYIDTLNFAEYIELGKVIRLNQIREADREYGGAAFYSCSWVEVAEALSHENEDAKLNAIVDLISLYCTVLSEGIEKCGFEDDKRHRTLYRECFSLPILPNGK